MAINYVLYDINNQLHYKILPILLSSLIYFAANNGNEWNGKSWYFRLWRGRGGKSPEKTKNSCSFPFLKRSETTGPASLNFFLFWLIFKRSLVSALNHFQPRGLYMAVIRGKETKHWGLRTKEFFVTFRYILRMLTKPKIRREKLYLGGVGETASFWVLCRILRSEPVIAKHLVHVHVHVHVRANYSLLSYIWLLSFCHPDVAKKCGEIKRLGGCGSTPLIPIMHHRCVAYATHVVMESWHHPWIVVLVNDDIRV